MSERVSESVGESVSAGVLAGNTNCTLIPIPLARALLLRKICQSKGAQGLLVYPGLSMTSFVWKLSDDKISMQLSLGVCIWCYMETEQILLLTMQHHLVSSKPTMLAIPEGLQLFRDIKPTGPTLQPSHSLGFL